MDFVFADTRQLFLMNSSVLTFYSTVSRLEELSCTHFTVREFSHFSTRGGSTASAPVGESFRPEQDMLLLNSHPANHIPPRAGERF